MTKIIFIFLMVMSAFNVRASFDKYIEGMRKGVEKKDKVAFLEAFKPFLGLLKIHIDRDTFPEALAEMNKLHATIDEIAKKVTLFAQKLSFSYHLSAQQIQELLKHISVLSILKQDTVPARDHVFAYRALRGAVLEYIDLSKQRPKAPEKKPLQKAKKGEPPRSLFFDPGQDNFAQIVQTSQPLIKSPIYTQSLDQTAQAEIERDFVERDDTDDDTQFISFLGGAEYELRKQISANASPQRQIINELLRLYKRDDGTIRSQLIGYEQALREEQQKIDTRNEQIYDSLKKIEPVIEQLGVKKRGALLRAKRQTHEKWLYEHTPLISVKIPGWADAVTYTDPEDKQSYKLPAKIGLYPGDIRSTFAVVGQMLIDYRLLYKPYKTDIVRFRREKLKQDAAFLVEEWSSLQTAANLQQAIVEAPQTSDTPMEGKKKKKKKKDEEKKKQSDEAAQAKLSAQIVTFLESYLDKNYRYMSFKIFDNPTGRAMLTYLVVDKIVSKIAQQVVDFDKVSHKLWQASLYNTFPFLAIFDSEYLSQALTEGFGLSPLEAFYRKKEAAHLSKEGAPSAPVTWLLEPLLRPQANIKNQLIHLLHGIAKFVNSVGSFMGQKPEPKDFFASTFEDVGGKLKISKNNYFKNVKHMLSRCLDAVTEVVCFGITMKFLDQAYQNCWKQYVTKHHEALYALVEEYQGSKKTLDDLYAHDNPDIELLKQAEDKLEKIDAKIDSFVERGHDLAEDNVIAFATGNPFWQHVQEAATAAEKMAMVIAGIFAVPTAIYLGKLIYDVSTQSPQNMKN